MLVLIRITGLTVTALEAFKRVGAHRSLLARMVVIGAIGVVAVDRLNHAAPSFVAGDATGFVVDQIQGLAHVSLTFAMLGHDVVEFLGVF
jgi:hypothetical protein